MALPRIREGEAYSSEGKEEFNHMIEYVFDYSDLDIKARDVKQILSDFSYDTAKGLKSIGLGSSKSREFVDFRIADSIGGGGQGVIDERFTLLPDGLQTRLALKRGLGDLGATGKDTMKKYVNRIDTGLMKDSVKYKTDGNQKRSYVRIGWVYLWQKYFGWQEEGTSQITPMNSLIRTHMEMLPRVNNYMSRFIRSYTRGTGDEVAGKGIDF